MLIEIKELLNQTFSEAGLPIVNSAPHNDCNYYGLEGGFLISPQNSTIIKVWISGLYNSANWLVDEQLYEVDLAEPSAKLSVVLKFAHRLKDLSEAMNKSYNEDIHQLSLDIRSEIQEMSEFYEQRPERNQSQEN